jgi:hypothetical protein
MLSGYSFFQVVDLAPFTTYSFRVSAVNSHGVSPLSKVSYFMLTLREGKKVVSGRLVKVWTFPNAFDQK